MPERYMPADASAEDLLRAKWVEWFLSLSPKDQLVAAEAIRQNSHIAHICRSEAHERYLREYQELKAELKSAYYTDLHESTYSLDLQELVRKYGA